MNKMPISLLVIMNLLVLCALGAVVLMMTGHTNMEWFVGNFGTWFVMVGAFAYVVFIDSRKRSPHLTASQRASRVITFSRDWEDRDGQG